jgi:hypothetical protein
MLVYKICGTSQFIPAELKVKLEKPRPSGG